MIGAALAAMALAAAAPALQLYPVRGVFFSRDGAALVDEDFRRAIGPAELAYFEQRFRAAYPDAPTTLDERNRRRTFAVSLQIARASRYEVAKPNGTVDVYLPVTASLYFTNVTTGEVLHASTRTEYSVASLMKDEVGPERVRALFAERFRGVVDSLIADGRARLRPIAISAVARARWRGLTILDAGAEQGLAVDDTLVDPAGNEVRVVAVGPNHAVARPELGSAAEGATFTKVASGTLAEVKRPRVLPIVEEVPAGVPPEALVQLFGDALGAAAPVSLVPVNRTFADVLAAVGAQTDLSQERLRQRELPALFVRLHVLDPVSYEAPTNLAYQRRRVTEAIAFAEVVDRGGRVLYAGQGRDRTEDVVTDGIALDPAARREIAVKNAIVALASRMGAELRLRPARLEISAGGDAIAIRDDAGLLAPRAAVRAYRDVGRVDGIAEDVVVPLHDLEITSTDQDLARARATLPVVEGAPAPEKGDFVALLGAGGAASRRRLGTCGAAEQLGSIALPGFGPLALNLFAAGYRGATYSSGLADRVGALVRGGFGFRSDLRLEPTKVDYCVQPVYRVDVTESKCDGDACTDVARVKLLYRVHAGDDAAGEIRVRRGAETRLTATTLPKATPPAQRARALEADLDAEVLKLAPVPAAGMAEEKL